MNPNQKKPLINFELLQDLDPIIDNTPLTRREKFYISVIMRVRRYTGKVLPYPPRKRKLHQWSRKVRKHV